MKRFPRQVVSTAVVALVASSPALAQRQVDHFALGVAAYEAHKPEEALGHFQTILATDSLNFNANVRAALAAADIVRKQPDEKRDRDGYYKLGTEYARRAIAIDSTKAEGHFLLALTLGYTSLGKAPQQRLNTAEEIWNAVHRAIALNPNDHRAYHVLGRWHAELSRFSWAKFITRGKLGALADSATWEGAVSNLKKAIELSPKFIYHHLDLADTYVAMKQNADARRHLLKIDSLPISDIRDSIYKADAKKLLATLPED